MPGVAGPTTTPHAPFFDFVLADGPAIAVNHSPAGETAGELRSRWCETASAIAVPRTATPPSATARRPANPLTPVTPSAYADERAEALAHEPVEVDGQQAVGLREVAEVDEEEGPLLVAGGVSARVFPAQALELPEIPPARLAADADGHDARGRGRLRLLRLVGLLELEVGQRLRVGQGLRPRHRLRPRLLRRALGRVDDRLRDARDGILAQAGRREELLGAVLGSCEDRASLGARPLERLLDLGARGIRQLDRLMARLLEQAVALCLGLLQLARGVGIRLREQLARLVLGGVQDLAALAIAFLPVALDLGLALQELALAAAHL